MLFEEYKNALEEILFLTNEIEELCIARKFDDIEKPFAKRDALFKNLSLPDDIPDDKVDFINNLAAQIQKKNDNMLKLFVVAQQEIKQELISLKGEGKVIDAYKVPVDINSKFFDSME